MESFHRFLGGDKFGGGLQRVGKNRWHQADTGIISGIFQGFVQYPFFGHGALAKERSHKWKTGKQEK
jgi:hypothetical protein